MSNVSFPPRPASVWYRTAGPAEHWRAIQTTMTDLDDLLEELDLDDFSSAKAKKQISGARPLLNTSASPAAALSAAKYSGNSKSSGGNTIDDVDSLLDDLDSVSPSSKKQTTVPISFEKPSEQVAVLAPSLRKGKCITIFLGGSGDQQGMGPGCACDRIRCSKCDFNVVRFIDTAWSERCDYLFFRNFFPDAEKLRANMESKRGAFQPYVTLCSKSTATRYLCVCAIIFVAWYSGFNSPHFVVVRI